MKEQDEITAYAANLETHANDLKRMRMETENNLTRQNLAIMIREAKAKIEALKWVLGSTEC